LINLPIKYSLTLLTHDVRGESLTLHHDKRDTKNLNAVEKEVGDNFEKINVLRYALFPNKLGHGSKVDVTSDRADVTKP